MTCQPWTPIYPCDIEGFDTALLAQADEAAQTFLHALSGGTVGDCTTTEEYVVPDNSICYVRDAPDSFIQNDRHECCRIRLERFSPRDITTVIIDTVTLDPAEYVLSGKHLIRLGTCWPREGDCAAPGIAITYTWGRLPDTLAQMALGAVSCDLYEGLTGGICSLSGRAVSVSRQGVTIEMESVTDLIESGKTGLSEADAFLRTVNPHALHIQSRVLSPDIPRLA